MIVGDLLDGKFRLVREIGVGAMASVWEAVEETTSKPVAIKLMNRSSDELRQRFLREARICTALSHPNIVDVFDVGETNKGNPFLVMQLLSGVTLAQLITQHGRLPAPIAAQIGRDIAQALATAHGANIVHRDLKPANVFLHQETPDHHVVVKVLDFGVAKDLAKTDALATTPGGLLGSPGYMSPEQVQGRRDVDGRADIWALGVVLFEMLLGNRPFQGRMTSILTGILTQPIPRISVFMPDIDPGLDEIVSRCMERNRDIRIASATIVSHMLQPFVRENEGSRALMVLASNALVSVGESTPEQSPDSTATKVPSSPNVVIDVLRAKKGFDMTLPLPMDAVPTVGTKGTLLIHDTPPTADVSASGPRGTLRMIESSKLIDEVAEARRVIEIKLAQQAPAAVEHSKTPETGIETPTEYSPSQRGSIPVLAIVLAILALAIVGVAVAIALH
jgi:serine/threonine protein kinase